jgi:hypothetical protein
MTSPEMTNGIRVRDAAAVKMFSAKASPSRAENNLTAPTCPYPSLAAEPCRLASYYRDAGRGGKAVRYA